MLLQTGQANNFVDHCIWIFKKECSSVLLALLDHFDAASVGGHLDIIYSWFFCSVAAEKEEPLQGPLT